MERVRNALQDVMTIKGALGSAIVDYYSRVTLAAIDGGVGFDLHEAGIGDTDVVRAKLRTLESLGYSVDSVEDILITLTKEYHLIRPVMQRRLQGIFIYLVLDRRDCELDQARAQLREIEASLEI
ncbi:hypothetical protein [Streptomyces sp. MST-110588]|uniref:hypothetical protein n=1 Tax=Streptomyces sp. MST-110588 TaxID=2833628 RepID=UPI001F5C9344|nr:hypothetical protein [Streptomyces sp. MST-110588]UNO39504.1 hypothetical protein KGS77_07680 [Streptomyces sp. MST-110588]